MALLGGFSRASVVLKPGVERMGQGGAREAVGGSSGEDGASFLLSQDAVVLVDELAILSGHPQEYCPFLRELLHTQAFSQFVSSSTP